MITWLVRFGDIEKNFAKKDAAIQFLRRWTKDTRPLSLYRRARGAYRYVGPGEDQWVLVAEIDRLDFPPLKFYRAKKGARSQKLAAVSQTTKVRV